MTGMFIFLAGAVTGSFLNVVIHRLPRGESLVKPASHCPACSQPLRWYQNIPLLSYLFLLGRCAMCRAPISSRYFIVELGSALIALYSFSSFGLRPVFFLIVVLAFVLIAVSFIDLEALLIPDKILLVFVIFFLIFNAIFKIRTWQFALSGALITGLVLYLLALFARFVLRREGLGLGDVKLMATAALFIGWKYSLLAFYSGALMVVIFAVFLRFRSFRFENGVVPFGPFLSLSTLIFIFFGDNIVSIYLNLL